MLGLLFISAITTKASGQLDTGLSKTSYIINAVSNSSFLLIAGIFVALFVCDDFEQQTIKNIYAKGYSRAKVYYSKLVFLWMATTVMYIIVLLGAWVLGMNYFSDQNIQVSALIMTLLVQYVICMANLSLFFAISFMLRKNGASTAAVIVGPMLINMILGLADSLLKPESTSLTRMWISSFLSDTSVISADNRRLVFCFIASLCYIAVFTVIGSAFHKRVEL